MFDREFPSSGPQFPSRRSTVMSTRGCVASSHHLASGAGLDILKAGGNAFDAAVATAATLAVVEPMSTGVGGDMFALAWSTRDQGLVALNGSGRAPLAATYELYRAQGHQSMPEEGMLSVTVPGAVDGWQTLLDRYGRMSLAQALRPAIAFARDGFPVAEVLGESWRRNAAKLARCPHSARTFLRGGRAPEAGHLFRLPELADTLEGIGQGGSREFYQGAIARSIVAYCQRNRGLITADDLAAHTSTWVEPISTRYRGYDVYECPPNGQGLAALLALNLVEGFDLGRLGHNTGEYLHVLIEAMKLAFGDAHAYIADPEHAHVPVTELLSQEHTKRRHALIRPEASSGMQPGQAGDDTVYLTVVDEERNAVSFINSLFSAFGSGVTAGDTGIMLQNRGRGFTLEPGHPNCLAPGKRPYHTIIPALIMKDGTPICSFGVMGGSMQPQGHLQVVCNMVDFGFSPQQALDAQRFRYLDGRRVALEPLDAGVEAELTRRGHQLIPYKDALAAGFGGGQVIVIDHGRGVLLAGSDPRKDGHAVGY